MKGGDIYRLFVYVEGTSNGDDGVLAPAVPFMVPYTNTFLTQPSVVDSLVSPEGFQLTFLASESEGKVWAMVVANIHEEWVDPNAIKVGTYSLGSAQCHIQGQVIGGMNETITLSQCALQRGVSYKAFAYVEGLNSTYTDGQASSPVSVVVPPVSMEFQSLPMLAKTVLTDQITFTFTPKATDQGATATIPANLYTMVVTELQAPLLTRSSVRTMTGALGGANCQVNGQSTVGGTAVQSLSQVSVTLTDCQLRHGTKYQLVTYIEDTNARSDGTLYFVSIMTPPGTSNGFSDFPTLVGNTTETKVSVQFTASEAVGNAWIQILPSSDVSAATATSIMAGTGAVGGSMCQTQMTIDNTQTQVDLDNCSLAFSTDYAVMVYVADVGMHDDGALAAAPFRSPTSNVLVMTPSVTSAIGIDGFTVSVETTKSGNLWAYVVSEANAALVTVATAKSGQMWAYGALSCRKLGQAITAGTPTTLTFSGCAMPYSTMLKLFVYVEDSNGMGDGMLSSAINIYVPGSSTFSVNPSVNGVPTQTAVAVDFSVAHDAGATIGTC